MAFGNRSRCLVPPVFSPYAHITKVCAGFAAATPAIVKKPKLNPHSYQEGRPAASAGAAAHAARIRRLRPAPIPIRFETGQSGGVRWYWSLARPCFAPDFPVLASTRLPPLPLVAGRFGSRWPGSQAVLILIRDTNV